MIARAIALVACVASCSTAAYYDRKVSGFERAKPDAEALARGDTASTERVLGWMSDWQTKIGDDHDVAPVPRQKLIDRLDAAARRYKLAAAAVAAPEIAFALARPLLTEGDGATLAIVRRAADGVAAERQQQLAKTGSYFHARAAAWTTTKSEMWMYEGDVGTYEEQELREQPASCVFATAPFGPEGRLNEALAFRVTASARTVYGRCYLHPEPNDLPVGRMAVVARLGGGAVRVRSGDATPGDHPHVDFTIDGAQLAIDRPFADLDVEVEYEYDGRALVLGRSKVFVDRDGAPPLTARAGS